MRHSVLILDDDTDFNNLLTDIFEQADYFVTSLEDPFKAIEAIADTEIDLVVTDHKMPEMSGVEFIAQVKKRQPKVPVIMVSGFLENDTIRDLINRGIGGVFLKPLNIFSLLERTAELIEESKRVDPDSQDSVEHSEEEELNENISAELGVPFHSFPCKSKASAHFAEKLYNLRNFNSNLSLIGEPGTHFSEICEDIRTFYANEKEQFIYLGIVSFNADQVLSMLVEAEQPGVERVTCVLLDVELMTNEQKALAIALSKSEGVFESVGVSVRTIFCVSGDLDVLYDLDQIDEDLYILMGTAEVIVPPLRECRSDITVMAQQLLAKLMNEKGLSSDRRFDAAARDFLSQYHWDQNFAQLKETVRRVLELSSEHVISLVAVSSALQSTIAATPRARVEAHLSSARNDYLRATAILLDSENSKVASFYGTEERLIESALK